MVCCCRTRLLVREPVVDRKLESDDVNVFVIEDAFGFSFFEGCVEADFVDCAESVSADAELDPHILLYPVEFLTVQIDFESAFCAALRVGYVVADS